MSGLAGGDRQRVALGRAIVRKPKCFLMDEPLGALDTEMREAMIAELRALHDRLGATTVYVTHDQLEAMAMADKIAVMNGGVVEQVGTPKDIYDKPVSLFVADFIGSPPMNFLRVPRRARAAARRRSGSAKARSACRSILDDRPEGDLILGVRPEHIRFGETRSGCAARSTATEYLGTTQIVTAETEFGTIRGARPLDCGCGRARRSVSTFRPDKLTLFDAASSTRASRRRSMRRQRAWLRSGFTRCRKQFGATQAVDDLTLSIGNGEFLVLLGPTGAGKTTTLRLVAGLEAPDRGSIFIDGRDVGRLPPGRARHRLRVPAIFALSAPQRVRQSRVSAAGADPPDMPSRRSGPR